MVSNLHQALVMLFYHSTQIATFFIGLSIIHQIHLLGH